MCISEKALKNAIDFLYNEWNNKAAGFVGITDFENFSVFNPAEHHKNSVDTMFDQVIAWSRALKTIH